MYKIITKTGEYLTDSPNFIRKHKNGSFVLTDEDNAEGIAHNGTPYMFKDGVIVVEVSASAMLEETERTIADNDAMTVDHEYRLTLLELGLNE